MMENFPLRNPSNLRPMGGFARTHPAILTPTLLALAIASTVQSHNIASLLHFTPRNADPEYVEGRGTEAKPLRRLHLD
jgi:hypothetical protein